MNHKKIRTYIELHGLFFIYSLGAVFSKYAAQNEILSLAFAACYGMVLIDLAVYAVIWQQVLKKLPLVTAYTNKAVTVIWGLLWGMVVFRERITVCNVAGAVIIMIGICVVVKADGT